MSYHIQALGSYALRDVGFQGPRNPAYVKVWDKVEEVTTQIKVAVRGQAIDDEIKA
jgi:hypothetical protein